MRQETQRPSLALGHGGDPKPLAYMPRHIGSEPTRPRLRSEVSAGRERLVEGPRAFSNIVPGLRGGASPRWFLGLPHGRELFFFRPPGRAPSRSRQDLDTHRLAPLRLSLSSFKGLYPQIAGSLGAAAAPWKGSRKMRSPTRRT